MKTRWVAGRCAWPIWPTRRRWKPASIARWWIIGVLAAVFPANVHMALHPERYSKVPEPALWARLPLQFVAAWWAWRATAAPAPDASPEAA